MYLYVKALRLIRMSQTEFVEVRGSNYGTGRQPALQSRHLTKTDLRCYLHTYSVKS
jgi:hypothetical protein